MKYKKRKKKYKDKKTNYLKKGKQKCKLLKLGKGLKRNTKKQNDNKVNKIKEQKG